MKNIRGKYVCIAGIIVAAVAITGCAPDAAEQGKGEQKTSYRYHSRIAVKVK